jgi:hypothetical protein
MDSQKSTLAIESRQENTIPRKAGVEIVYSANLSSRFFHGPSRFRGLAILGSDDDWRRRVERASRQ